MTGRAFEKAKARALERSRLRNRFVNETAGIETDIRILADRIDDLGQLGEQIGHADPTRMCPDEVGCYASNCLQGVLALLREMRRATKFPAAAKRGRR